LLTFSIILPILKQYIAYNPFYTNCGIIPVIRVHFKFLIGPNYSICSSYGCPNMIDSQINGYCPVRVITWYQRCGSFIS